MFKMKYLLLFTLSFSTFASGINLQSFSPSHGHNFTYSMETLDSRLSLFQYSPLYFSTNYSFYESPILTKDNSIVVDRIDSLEMRVGYLWNKRSYFGVSTSAARTSFATEESDWALADTTIIYKYQLPQKFMGASFAISPQLILPTGDKDLLLSDDSLGGQISFIAARKWAKFEAIGNIGYRYTDNARFNNLKNYSRMIGTIGFNYYINDKLAIGPEYYQEYTLDKGDDNFLKFTSVNAHYRLDSSVKAFASVGTGDLTEVTQDRFRAILGVKFVPVLPTKERVKLVEKEVPRKVKTKSIYFSWNSTKLTKTFKEELRELAKSLNKNQTIRIIGQADISGRDEYNTLLAKRRALAVRDYLVNQGVDEAYIDISSRGELPSKSSIAAKDRKVDILFE
jgi:outer membrane protein OmpA-like peptidoglycan-associated protein